MSDNIMSGADIVIKALADQGVEVILVIQVVLYCHFMTQYLSKILSDTF